MIFQFGWFCSKSNILGNLRLHHLKALWEMCSLRLKAVEGMYQAPNHHLTAALQLKFFFR